MTDGASGTVLTEQANLPYGTALTGESSGAINNRRFTSYDRSVTTGMDYAVNRFYSAAQGRFTQVDPIGMGATSLSDPQSLNLYSYCGNDPINRVDPDGLFFKWVGKAFKFLFKVAAIALFVVAMILLPGAIAGFVAWKGWLILMGVAGWAGLAGWHNGKLGAIARGSFTAGASWGGNARTPNTFPNGSGVGGVSSFVGQQKRERQLRPQIILIFTPTGNTVFEDTQKKVVENIDAVVGSKACNDAFAKAGLTTPKDIYAKGIIIGPRQALASSDYNDVLGLSDAKRIELDETSGRGGTTIIGSKRGKPIILFGGDAFVNNPALREAVAHEFIHAAGIGSRPIRFSWLRGGHDLSGYEHYDNIINACR